MKIKLAVMFGGRSVEHEISVISAIQAIHAVDKDKYDVIPIYITKNNEMYVGEHIGEIEAYKNINALIVIGKLLIYFVSFNVTIPLHDIYIVEDLANIRHIVCIYSH